MNTLIQVEGLAKNYRKRGSREPIKAVNDVSFKVEKGEIVGLLGPNGAGKTTTIKMICSLIKPDSGFVNVNGFDAQSERQKALKHISAVLEGNRNLYWRLSVKENLEYFAGNRGRSAKAVRAAVNSLLVQFRLESKRNELVNNLSRGMQQKLAIAVAMLAETEVILLDEPTLGLDVETGYEVRQLLKDIASAGRTVIISTHDMPVVQDLCKRTVIINQGEVVVDDEVANLMRLFDTKAYNIELGSLLSQTQVNTLKATFPIISINDDLTSFSVNFRHDEDIYVLMDILRSQQTLIESIDRTTIHFEQVFRDLVKQNEGVANHVMA